MLFSPKIPQDIIAETLKHLHDDPKTLKQCSIVSHTFCRPARAHLFRTVKLNTPEIASSLNDTLLKNDYLPPLVRCLHIPVAGSTIAKILPILPKLDHVQYLIIGEKTMTLSSTMSDLVATLPPLFQLPQLMRLELLCIFEFPASLLVIQRRVEWMAMHNVGVLDNLRNMGNLASILPALRRIDFSNVLFFRKSQVLYAPNLRQVSIGGFTWGIQHIILSGKQSIEDIVL